MAPRALATSGTICRRTLDLNADRIFALSSGVLEIKIADLMAVLRNGAFLETRLF
jgi:hypothetical protein